MKVLLTLLLAVSALCGETRQERGKRVIEEALAALGGDKFLAVKDRVEAGRAYSFYREQLTGLAVAKIYTKYLDGVPPRQLAQRERQSFGKDEDHVIVFLADNAYQITYRGAKPLPSERFQRYVHSARRNIFYILRHRLNEPGMIFESQGATVWSNAPVEIVDITDAENNVVSVAFHRTTKLPVRQVSYRRDPETKERIEEVSIYSKYRNVGGGVQWPYSIMAERNGEKVFELYSESVMVNQNLKDELFSLPGGIKVLPAEK